MKAVLIATPLAFTLAFIMAFTKMPEKVDPKPLTKTEVNQYELDRMQRQINITEAEIKLSEIIATQEQIIRMSE